MGKRGSVCTDSTTSNGPRPVTPTGPLVSLEDQHLMAKSTFPGAEPDALGLSSKLTGHVLTGAQASAEQSLWEGGGEVGGG